VYYRRLSGYNETVHRLLWPLLLSAISLAATVPTGPNTGEPAPDFRLQDQAGTPRALHSLMGPKGLMLVFYRSADW
jgi:hypothetical protein